MYRLINILRLIRLSPKIVFYAYAYYRPASLSSNLIEKLQDCLSAQGLSLCRDDLKRISYYIVLNRIMISSFAILRGERLTTREKYLGSLMGAFTPVYDDLMDDDFFTHEETRAFMQGDISDTNSSKQWLIAFLYDEISSIHPSIDLFDRYFDQAGIAQDRSINEQKDRTTSLEATRDITYQKGGNFCLLFRSGLFHDWLEGEESALYLLGGMTQYVDDIFDLQKDVTDSTYTIPAKILSVDNIRADYKRSISRCYNAFLETAYKKSNIKKFWSIQYLTLSRGFVAMDHFSNSPVIESIEMITSLDRQMLVVDMEKIQNVWKNIMYLINFKN